MTDLEGQAMDLFAEVVGAGASERDARLQAAFANVPELRAKVEELFANQAMAETVDFLEPPPTWIDAIPRSLPDFREYERIEYLGHGGMGVVYQAFDKVLDCHVALKTPLPGRLTTAEVVALFHTEPRTMARLKHANIVQVHKVDQHDGKPYFTMNLIHGAGLKDCPGAYREDPRAAAALLIKAARAVHHAHLRGILHRDLKPGNILIDGDGEPVITDFGLAKLVGQDESLMATTSSLPTASCVYQGVIGTVSYMPPEQADPRKEVTALSDVYGLGAVLYAMLTGRPPFPAETPLEALNRVRDPSCRPTPPRILNPYMNCDLEAICLKCLEKDPERRYRSAESLARDLERWLNHEPPTGPGPANLWRRCRLWSRRNPLGVSLFVIALSFIALLGLRLYELWQEPARAQAVLAKSEASTVQFRLQELRRAVEFEVQKPELAKLVKQNNRGPLQAFIDRVEKERRDLDGKSPFESWYVVGRAGELLARSPAGIPQDYDRSRRDYFKGAIRLAEATGRSPVYTSRVYYGPHVEGDPFPKNPRFGMAAVIRNDSAILGVLVASVATGPIMGFSPGGDYETPTALLAPIDQYRLEEDFHVTPDAASDFLILLHPAFQRGQPQAVWFPKDQLQAMEKGITDAFYDPVAEFDGFFAGRWLAGFAKVEDSPFVVVAQRRHTPALPGGVEMAVVAIALVLAGVAAYGLRRTQGEKKW